VVRPQLIDEFLPKVEWIERSNGKLRADVAHDKLVALGFTGSERTTRRAVAAVKKNYRPGRVRVLGPLTNRFATGAWRRHRRRSTECEIPGPVLAIPVRLLTIRLRIPTG